MNEFTQGEVPEEVLTDLLDIYLCRNDDVCQLLMISLLLLFLGSVVHSFIFVKEHPSSNKAAKQVHQTSFTLRFFTVNTGFTD